MLGDLVVFTSPDLLRSGQVVVECLEPFPFLSLITIQLAVAS